jgi:7-cyano-7-deazaguanine synthase
MKAMHLALNLGLERRLRIETPLMWIDKAATWQMARDLGGDALVELVVNDTHTCYQGTRDVLHGWGYGCGSCPACELRANGWQRWKRTQSA